MSTIFGSFIQQGYVVPDIHAALAHWLARGVGPFFLEEHIRPPGEYDGEPILADISAAFSFSGDQQIEVVQPCDDTRTVYSQFLRHHPTGGLQHVAVWVDDIPAKLAELEARGQRFVVRQRYGDMHVYLDTAESPGVMVQLMARVSLMTDLFDAVQRACRAWDGTSDPIRKIDWSTGLPRID